MKRFLTLFLIIFISAIAFSQEKIEITGVIDWETMEIRSTTSLDLASAGLRLPAGRNQAESILVKGYTGLVRSGILDLQVDSSSVIADLIERNELSLQVIESLSLPPIAQSVPYSLSSDMRSMLASFTIPITELNTVLQRHLRPSPVSRVLNPVSAANYTGIVIIASEPLPAHGLRSSMLPVPCLFPKIWDTDMNLIYERNMVIPQTPAARYSSAKNILFNSPSGLTAELEAVVGNRPLRIFARGVFGIKPTDLIIDRADALQIISSEQNRNLLTQGKVVFILDESVLTQEFNSR